jgi:Ca2+-binding RTX toxin-like protein
MTRHDLSRRPSLESLEERLALTSFQVSGGYLYVYGDNLRNTVSLSSYSFQIDRGTYSTSQYRVTRGVIFYGEGGDDDFYNSTYMPSWVYGGRGRDRLSGGSGNDVLKGDDDNDHISGNGGTNYLYGGNHDDRLYGGNGTDYLYGDAGRDDLFGYGGNDYLYGGSDRDRDNLDGGSGRNGARFDGYDRIYNIHYRI